LIRGLAWLPDGSGFVYAVEEYENYEVACANIFEYTFASKQIKRLTNFDTQYAGQLSVSPDSKQIVFDRSTAKDDTGTTDVWIMNRDGSGQRLLVSNGYAPAWSPGLLPAPLSSRVYLPFSQR
jgi:TolB protein